MLNLGGHDVKLLYLGSKSVKAIYKGPILVWSSIRSCFGNGYWASDKPWDNEDKWVNG